MYGRKHLCVCSLFSIYEKIPFFTLFEIIQGHFNPQQTYLEVSYSSFATLL